MWTWAGTLAVTVATVVTVGTIGPVGPVGPVAALTKTAASANTDVRTTGTFALAAPAPSGRWVTIVGRGFGHGVGMAQDGAYWMGRQGRSSAEILRHFYPGTSLGSQNGDIRVPLGEAGTVTLLLGEGGTIGGRPVAPGGSVTVRPAEGQLVATISAPPERTVTKSSTPGPALAMRPISLREQTPTPPGDGPTATPTIAAALPPPEPPSSGEPSGAAILLPGIVPDAPPPPSTAPSSIPSSLEVSAEPTTSETAGAASPSASGSPPSAPDTIRGDPLVVTTTDNGTVTYAGRRYRGSFELRAQGGVRVVNELDVEQYLRGMGEVTDPRWPAAALQAQAIAARTYALRTMASAGEVCPTQRCQVYVGVRAEYGAMDDAVTATRGKVVTYDKGKLAVTFYSASGGGTIATPQEAFGGSGDFPYLQSGTYPTGDLKSWVVFMTIDEIGRRIGYGGRAARVEVTGVGPSGRATEVTVSGAGADLIIDGPRFDAALGLRSTLFTLRQSVTPTIEGLGDVDVLRPSEPANTSGDEGNEVFAQTGFFDVPQSNEEPIPAAVATASTSPSASRASNESTGDEKSAPASPMSGQRAENASSTRRAPSDTGRSHQSDVVFLSTLTAVGATALAGARRLRRTRRGRVKPPR